MNDLLNYDAIDGKLRLKSQLKQNLNAYNCIFLCIGSDKVTGDCLGPLTGELLTKNYNVNAYIYGTLDKPITAQNLTAAEKFIRKKHKKYKIVAIDASLGHARDIGNIKLHQSGLLPGSAVNHKLPSVGDFSITATVNCGNASDPSLLFSTSLCFVFKLANTIAQSIAEFLQEKSLA